MKPKKGIIILSITVVVLVGLFVGIKINNSVSTANKETLKPNDKIQEKKNTNDSLGYDYEIEEKDKNNENQKKVNNGESEKKENNNQSDEKVNNNQSEEEVNNDESEETIDKEIVNETDKTTEEEKNKNSEDAIQIEVFNDKYAVQEGDTLFSIARDFCPDEAANEVKKLIILANEIENENKILIGQELYIPTESNFEKKSEKSLENNGVAYEVKKGDTLSTIADSNMSWCDVDTAVELLMENNHIEDADCLQANAVIYIPQNEESNEN
jgi:LysM repeat protein